MSILSPAALNALVRALLLAEKERLGADRFKKRMRRVRLLLAKSDRIIALTPETLDEINAKLDAQNALTKLCDEDGA